MCGNRVEELESRVNELEASVEGLTDELVECKVRIRELEDAFESEVGFVPEPSDAAEVAEADGAEAPKREAPEAADTESESDSDIIIA